MVLVRREEKNTFTDPCIRKIKIISYTSLPLTVCFKKVYVTGEGLKYEYLVLVYVTQTIHTLWKLP